MKSIPIILYLILYILFAVFSWVGILFEGHNPLLSSMNILCHSGAALCILFYILNYRPKAPALLWKLLPVVLVINDVYLIWFEIDFWTSVLVALSIVSFPSWYFSFRIGYFKELAKASDNDKIKEENTNPNNRIETETTKKKINLALVESAGTWTIMIFSGVFAVGLSIVLLAFLGAVISQLADAAPFIFAPLAIINELFGENWMADIYSGYLQPLFEVAAWIIFVVWLVGVVLIAKPTKNKSEPNQESQDTSQTEIGENDF